MVLFSSYTIRSSRNHPFLIVSPKSIVANIDAPDTKTFLSMLDYCRQLYLKKEDVKIIFDAEGEMLGFGGMMKIVTFMFLNQRDIQGLVVDMTCEQSISLARDILTNDYLQKIAWGIESDLSSLMHQRIPLALSIIPVNVFDLQKMFTKQQKYAFGMKKALSCIRDRDPNLLLNLPSKDIIEWNEPYSKNKEALPFPLSDKHIKYSVDDLHRIAIIYTTRKQEFIEKYNNKYRTIEMTKYDISRISNDIYGREWFYRQIKSYKNAKRLNKPLVQILSKIVPIQRHITYLKNYFGPTSRYLSPCDCSNIDWYESEFDELLTQHNVSINKDLSFNT